MSEFRAAWWCRNRHLQTIWAALFRKRRLAFVRERLVLDDGDFLDLDWVAPRATANSTATAGAGAGRVADERARVHRAAGERAAGERGVDERAAAARIAVRRGAADRAGSSRAADTQSGPGYIAAGPAGAAPIGRASDAPLVLVLHGLEGSSTSHYVVGLLEGVRARGWRGVALNFRSCSGEMNRLPRFYHSGDTADLETVVRLILEREPGVQLGIVGVSLGGNVLLKWLGEPGTSAAAVVAGAAISVPFDLARCARTLDQGFRKQVYTRNFLWTMRRKVVDKARAYPGFVDVAAAQRARTFAEYDRAVTAPLFGFADERDYWQRASCRPFLASIERPVLVINALDDPFVPADAIPTPDELSPSVRLELTPDGGHVGFLDGRWPWIGDSWAERHALDHLAPFLRD